MKIIWRSVTFLLCLLPLLSSGAQAQGFSFKDTAGKIHSLADYRGKWVLVNFWATWCPPCLEEIPDLVSLYESRKDVMVIGIVMDYRDPRTVLKFVDSLAISYPIVFGNKSIVAQVGPVSMLPTTYLFNPAGRPAAYKVGIISRKSLEDFMQENSANPPRNNSGGPVQLKHK
ncbi:MAG: TlpA disulfide reductase family protein [Nitrosospira sp.]|nr:TlpA disulfide reductase family protein [Nitrosospira sp.]